jgi:hypothetical protein
MRKSLREFWGYPPWKEKISPEEQRFPKAFVSLRGERRGGEKFFWRGNRERERANRFDEIEVGKCKNNNKRSSVNVRET